MYQAWRRSRVGVTQSGSGFIVPAGGASLRGIIFNGSTQYAQTGILPNSSPWNNLGEFQIIMRTRATSSTSGQLLAIWNTASEVERFTLNIGGTGTRFDFHDNRDSLDIFHTPNTFTNAVVKLQYDPATPRWTLESWKADGTGYVSGSVALTTTTNWNFGSAAHKLTLASTMYGTSPCDPHVDWLGMKQSVDTMGSGNFPGADIPSGTYILKYTFDADTGADTSGSALDLTLTGTPSFENTP